MATNTAVKFYKFSSSSSTYADRITAAKAVEGAIIYIVDAHELWVGGSNPQMVLKGCSNVAYDSNTKALTIDNGSGTTQTLDFSDTASATGVMNVFKHMNDLIGVVEDSSTNPATTKLDYTGTNYLGTQTTLTGADKRLDSEIKSVWDAVQTAGKVDDVKIGTQSIVTNKVAVFETDETYDATNNKIATVQTVTDAINGLDSNSVGGATVGTTSITIQGVREEDGVIYGGNVETINLDGTYDDTNNKIATQSTVADAINALDVTTSVGNATVSGSTITIQGVKQTDGKIVDGDVTTIDLDGTYNATSNKIATQVTVANAIAALDGSATIASESNGVVTLKAGVTEADGVISNASGSDITLAKVATTGSADDVNVTYQSATQTVSQAVTKIDSRITALEGLPTYDVVVLGPSENLPTASADTMHKIYLKPLSGTQPQGDIYEEYITVRSGSEGSYTYSWEKLGTTAASLDGYAKSVTVNGHQYTVTNNGTDINIGNVITGVTGETAIVDDNNDFVAVTATTGAVDATTGTQSVTLSSSIKTLHPGQVQGTNDGLATASGVKTYVEAKISDLQKASTTANGTNVHVTYSETDGIVSLDTITEDYATITRTAKASGVAPNLTVASGDESKMVKASDIANVKAYADDKVVEEIEGLDADVTSDDAAVATVEVVEVDGKITDVVVTNISAGVQYTAASGGTPANLAASTSTGAVTGADITAIKNYVDAHTANVVQGTQTLTVNDANPTTLATVDGTPITAKVSLVWEEYA